MAINQMAHSPLGEGRPKLPIAGKIHAGIKVLTRAAQGNEAACKVYAQGVAAGRSFDQIEKDVRSAMKIDQAATSPLVPKNTPFFRVSGGDFGSPDTARRILDLYGEDRGEGIQLYRFPVILPMDSWQDVMPHALSAYGARVRMFWSEYDGAGKRFCMEYAGAQMDQRNQRAVRRWGGRGQQVRKVCDPESCAEYQRKVCSLRGQLMFYIPEVPGTGLISLASTSIYSMQQMRGQMELVAGLRGGRISGVNNGEPIFWLAKVQQEVSMLDDKGQPKRVKQWLTHLESNIDVFDMMKRSEQAALAHHGQTALSAPTPTAAEIDEDPEPGDEVEACVADLRQQIQRLARDKKVSGAKLAAEMTVRFGEGWANEIGTLEIVKDELEDRP